MSLTTRKMSSRHEEDVANLLGARRTKNSGAVWNDQTDGKQSYREQHYTFAFDGKSTLGSSIGITRKMVDKVREQAHWARWCIPLRFYRDERLTTVDEELVVLPLSDFVELLTDANAFRDVWDQGCLVGIHDWNVPTDPTTCRVCGSSTWDLMEYEPETWVEP